MNKRDFEQYIFNCKNTLPAKVMDASFSREEREVEALIHLNSSIYPNLNRNTGMLLEYLEMKNSPEKLRVGLIWYIGLQSAPNDILEIVQLLDNYVKEAVSITHK